MNIELTNNKGLIVSKKLRPSCLNPQVSVLSSQWIQYNTQLNLQLFSTTIEYKTVLVKYESYK